MSLNGSSIINGADTCTPLSSSQAAVVCWSTAWVLLYHTAPLPTWPGFSACSIRWCRATHKITHWSAKAWL